MRNDKLKNDCPKNDGPGKDCRLYREPLHDLVDGRLRDDERQRVEEHLAVCPSCRDARVEIARLVDLLGHLPDEKAPEGFVVGVIDGLARDRHRSPIVLRDHGDRRLTERSLTERRLRPWLPWAGTLAAGGLLWFALSTLSSDHHAPNSTAQRSEHIEVSRVESSGDAVASVDLSSDDLPRADSPPSGFLFDDSAEMAPLSSPSAASSQAELENRPSSQYVAGSDISGSDISGSDISGSDISSHENPDLRSEDDFTRSAVSRSVEVQREERALADNPHLPSTLMESDRALVESASSEGTVVKSDDESLAAIDESVTGLERESFDGGDVPEFVGVGESFARELSKMAATRESGAEIHLGVDVLLADDLESLSRTRESAEAGSAEAGSASGGVFARILTRREFVVMVHELHSGDIRLVRDLTLARTSSSSLGLGGVGRVGQATDEVDSRATVDSLLARTAREIEDHKRPSGTPSVRETPRGGALGATRQGDVREGVSESLREQAVEKATLGKARGSSKSPERKEGKREANELGPDFDRDEGVARPVTEDSAVIEDWIRELLRSSPECACFLIVVRPPTAPTKVEPAKSEIDHPSKSSDVSEPPKVDDKGRVQRRGV